MAAVSEKKVLYELNIEVIKFKVYSSQGHLTVFHCKLACVAGAWK